MAQYEQLDSPDETYIPPGIGGHEFYEREPVISWPYYAGGAGLLGVPGDAIAGARRPSLPIPRRSTFQVRKRFRAASTSTPPTATSGRSRELPSNPALAA